MATDTQTDPSLAVRLLQLLRSCKEACKAGRTNLLGHNTHGGIEVQFPWLTRLNASRLICFSCSECDVAEVRIDGDERIPVARWWIVVIEALIHLLAADPYSSIWPPLFFYLPNTINERNLKDACPRCTSHGLRDMCNFLQLLEVELTEVYNTVSAVARY